MVFFSNKNAPEKDTVGEKTENNHFLALKIFVIRLCKMIHARTVILCKVMHCHCNVLATSGQKLTSTHLEPQAQQKETHPTHADVFVCEIVKSCIAVKFLP